MSWSLSNGDGKWRVVREDGEVEGTHDSRTDAIKHQRSLYANESRVAAMYAELDEKTEEYGWVTPEEVNNMNNIPEQMESSLSPFATELVGLILKDEREKSLTASLARSMDAISERMAYEKEERGALVAALSQIGQPVINVAAPEVTVEVPAPEVQIDVQPPEITVQTPEIRVDVQAPNVTVRPEITMPSSSKTITFERDPLTGQVSKADVTEQ